MNDQYLTIFTFYSQKRVARKLAQAPSDTTQCTNTEHDSNMFNNYTIRLYNTTNNQLYITMYLYVRCAMPKSSENWDNHCNIARNCHFNNTTTSTSSW